MVFLTGELNACSIGTNFTPHIITVNAGEVFVCLFVFFQRKDESNFKIFCILIIGLWWLKDVTMKVISFSQQGPRAICILSANGIISSVTLRQPDSSGGTLTYEVSQFPDFVLFNKHHLSKLLMSKCKSCCLIDESSVHYVYG